MTAYHITFKLRRDFGHKVDAKIEGRRGTNYVSRRLSCLRLSLLWHFCYTSGNAVSAFMRLPTQRRMMLTEVYHELTGCVHPREIRRVGVSFWTDKVRLV